MEWKGLQPAERSTLIYSFGILEWVFPSHIPLVWVDSLEHRSNALPVPSYSSGFEGTKKESALGGRVMARMYGLDDQNY